MSGFPDWQAKAASEAVDEQRKHPQFYPSTERELWAALATAAVYGRFYRMRDRERREDEAGDYNERTA